MSLINEKRFINKRRLDGLELEDGKKRKKAKINNKDDRGPLASFNGDQSLAVKAESIPSRTLTKRELWELKNPKKQYIQSIPNQKLAEVGGVGLSSDNRPSKIESERIPYKLEVNSTKHEEERGLGWEQATGTLMARNKGSESAGGRRRRRKFVPDAKNDQDRAKYSWTLSESVGGQMLGLDPIFSLNEE